MIIYQAKRILNACLRFVLMLFQTVEIKAQALDLSIIFDKENDNKLQELTSRYHSTKRMIIRNYLLFD